MKLIDKAIAELNEFIETGSVPDTRWGLCNNFDLDFIWDEYDIDVNDVFDNWEHFSGYDLYPVPCTEPGINDEHTQYKSYPEYGGKQLELRISLAKYLVEYIEAIKVSHSHVED